MADTSLKMRHILLLAFSSDQPGEIANAVAKFRELAETQGADIHAIADRLAGLVKTSSCEPNFDGDVDASDVAAWALRSHMDRLRANEISFLQSMKSWRGDPTDKQAAWLASIVARLRRQGQ